MTSLAGKATAYSRGGEADPDPGSERSAVGDLAGSTQRDAPDTLWRRPFRAAILGGA